MSQTSRGGYSSGDSSPREGFRYWGVGPWMGGSREGSGRCVCHTGPVCWDPDSRRVQGLLAELRALKDWECLKGNLAQPPLPSPRSTLTAGSEKPESLVTAAAHWYALLPPLLLPILLLLYNPSPPAFLPFLALPHSAIRRPLTACGEGHSPQTASLCLSFSLILWAIEDALQSDSHVSVSALITKSQSWEKACCVGERSQIIKQWEIHIVHKKAQSAEWINRGLPFKDSPPFSW